MHKHYGDLFQNTSCGVDISVLAFHYGQLLTGLPHCRLDGKAAAQQAGATAPTGADQALPPPPPKPHSRNKESSSSRADGDVNGEHMHACMSCLFVMIPQMRRLTQKGRSVEDDEEVEPDSRGPG